MLTAPRPDSLATADERLASDSLEILEKQIGASDSPERAALRERAARLRGVITWRLVTEYDERLTAAHQHLHELNADVEALNQRYEAFVRTRQAATHSYVGYDGTIKRLRGRVADAPVRIDDLK